MNKSKVYDLIELTIMGSTKTKLIDWDKLNIQKILQTLAKGKSILLKRKEVKFK